MQHIYATSGAFAALKADGTVVAWGKDRDRRGVAEDGGDCSEVQAQLVDVQSICSTGNQHGGAFAALKADGSVVAWGSKKHGGDCGSNQEQLASDVQSIASAKDGAFAALKTAGSVVTWGWAPFGGDSSKVQHQLVDVQSIYTTKAAFAALKADGTVVAWGDNRQVETTAKSRPS